MADPTIPISPEAQPVTVNLPGEDLGPNVTPNEDGGVTVDFGNQDLPAPTAMEHDTNLAEVLDEKDLDALASDLVADFEDDLRTRADWEKTYIQGLDLLGLKIDERTMPWPGACGVYHPVLTEAVIRFQAQTIMEVFPSSGPVRTKIIGKANEELLKQANRVQEEMNYVVTERMEDYRPETEQLLFRLPLAGSAFRKIYYDPVNKRPAAVFVPAEDFVVTYGTTDLAACPRYTHVTRMYPNELRKLQVSGFYRDVDIPPPSPILSDLQKKYDKVKGETPSIVNDQRHQILEMCVDLDLPGFESEDGVELPYIVTIEKDSRKVLAIRRNWKQDDPNREKRQHFVHYQYLPGLGFYGTGLIHLIGGIAKSATSILRQLVDAGTLSNLPGGLKARGLRIKGDDNPIMPGEFRDVDVASGSIRDSITFLPYKEPSSVLYQLLGNLVDEGRRIGSIAEMDIGDANSEAPVGTTLALLERSMKVMSAVQARVHDSLGKEFKLIAEVIKEYMGPEYEYVATETPGQTYSRLQDFDDRVDIIPVSDPNAATMAQKVMQYQAALQLAQGAPPGMYNMEVLHKQMLHALNVQNVDLIIQGQQQAQPTDPVTENQMVMSGKPVTVFIQQDHDAHIKVHTAFMNDPIYQQFVSQSPNAQMIVGAMQQHLAEHFAYSYRRQLELQLGVSLPNMGEKLPIDVENDIAKIAAVASDKLLQQHNAEARLAELMQEENDPLTVMQREELEIKEREAAAKELSAVAEAKFKEGKLQLEAVKTLATAKDAKRSDEIKVLTTLITNNAKREAEEARQREAANKAAGNNT